MKHPPTPVHTPPPPLSLSLSLSLSVCVSVCLPLPPSLPILCNSQFAYLHGVCVCVCLCMSVCDQGRAYVKLPVRFLAPPPSYTGSHAGSGHYRALLEARITPSPPSSPSFSVTRASAGGRASDSIAGSFPPTTAPHRQNDHDRHHHNECENEDECEYKHGVDVCAMELHATAHPTTRFET